MNRSKMFTLAVIHMTVAFAACQNSTPPVDPESQRVEGECQTVYGGEICTWGVMAGENVVEFGADIALSSIDNAPLDAEMIFPPVPLANIPLPAGVSEKTGIDHLGIFWEAHGHPPATFLTPHFDFHFYTVGMDVVNEIDCSDESKPDLLPAGYALPDLEIPGMGTLVGSCVPKMGMHSLSETEMQAEDVFGASMVIGYYSKNLVFLEPMISRDRLMAQASFSLDVPSVNGKDPSVWPSSFDANYDAENARYRFVFALND